MNVRSDVPAAFATEAPITTEATSNEAPPSAVIEGGNSMQIRNADAWCPQVDDTVMAAGWDDEAWIAVSEEPAVGAGWEDDLSIGMAEEPAAAGWEDAWSALGDEAPAVTAGWDDDATALRVGGQVPSLEALTLSFAADLLPDEPLRLDALDVAATLASEDAVFDFDGADATGAVFHVPRVEERRAHAVALDESPVAADPFAAYVAAVVDVAQAAGHTRAAAALPLLLQGVEFDAATLHDDTRARLLAAGVLCAAGGSVSLNETFSSTASAWRDVLRGSTEDLSVCGDTTLDAWSADLLRALGVGQGTATDVRRELRRRGVAAFGMLLAA